MVWPHTCPASDMGTRAPSPTHLMEAHVSLFSFHHKKKRTTSVQPWVWWDDIAFGNQRTEPKSKKLATTKAKPDKSRIQRWRFLHGEPQHQRMFASEFSLHCVLPARLARLITSTHVFILQVPVGTQGDLCHQWTYVCATLFVEQWPQTSSCNKDIIIKSTRPIGSIFI